MDLNCLKFSGHYSGDTWNGAKEDTAKDAEWSKDKVNDGAKYIEKKTD